MWKIKNVYEWITVLGGFFTFTHNVCYAYYYYNADKNNDDVVSSYRVQILLPWRWYFVRIFRESYAVLNYSCNITAIINIVWIQIILYGSLCCPLNRLNNRNEKEEKSFWAVLRTLLECGRMQTFYATRSAPKIRPIIIVKSIMNNTHILVVMSELNLDRCVL